MAQSQPHQSRARRFLNFFALRRDDHDRQRSPVDASSYADIPSRPSSTGAIYEVSPNDRHFLDSFNSGRRTDASQQNSQHSTTAVRPSVPRLQVSPSHRSTFAASKSFPETPPQSHNNEHDSVPHISGTHLMPPWIDRFPVRPLGLRSRSHNYDHITEHETCSLSGHSQSRCITSNDPLVHVNSHQPVTPQQQQPQSFRNPYEHEQSYAGLNFEYQFARPYASEDTEYQSQSDGLEEQSENHSSSEHLLPPANPYLYVMEQTPATMQMLAPSPTNNHEPPRALDTHSDSAPINNIVVRSPTIEDVEADDHTKHSTQSHGHRPEDIQRPTTPRHVNGHGHPGAQPPPHVRHTQLSLADIEFMSQPSGSDSDGELVSDTDHSQHTSENAVPTTQPGILTPNLSSSSNSNHSDQPFLNPDTESPPPSIAARPPTPSRTVHCCRCGSSLVGDLFCQDCTPPINIPTETTSSEDTEVLCESCDGLSRYSPCSSERRRRTYSISSENSESWISEIGSVRRCSLCVGCFAENCGDHCCGRGADEEYGVVGDESDPSSSGSSSSFSSSDSSEAGRGCCFCCSCKSGHCDRGCCRQYSRRHRGCCGAGRDDRFNTVKVEILRDRDRRFLPLRMIIDTRGSNEGSGDQISGEMDLWRSISRFFCCG